MTENFDSENLPWDFKLIWMQAKDSNLHLQRFQEFNFSFNINSYPDKIKSTTFVYNSEEKEEATIKYGEKFYINIVFQPNIVGFYKLESILLNSDTLNLGIDFEDCAVPDENGVVTAYKIPVTANDSTDGPYSFTIGAKSYQGIITVSNEAKDNNQGGIQSRGAKDPSPEKNIPFTYDSALREFEAVGNGIFEFDHWDLYHIKAGGEPVFVENFDGANNPIVSIKFGSSEYFKQDFKLIAYFTSEHAILLSFDKFKPEEVVSLKISDTDYLGEKVRVSPKNTQLNITLVTAKGFIIKVPSFLAEIQNLYGENSIIQIADPLLDEKTQQTTYKFRLNMTQFQDLGDTNELTLSLNVIQDDSGNGSDLLWLYITAPVVVVVIAGIITFVLLRRRRGGGKKSKKSNKPEEKKDAYQDYYL